MTLKDFKERFKNVPDDTKINCMLFVNYSEEYQDNFIPTHWDIEDTGDYILISVAIKSEEIN